jgi:N-acetyl-1-D-myo-inositol-2-amino-2-deoxy-alpha-D-glucopyranoside deacetylase
METNDDPRCFWQADVKQAAGELVRIIREVRPQVLVTYDENGFYGHPDHIQAHRVARAAIDLAAEGGQGSWQVAKFYATAMPQSVATAAGLPWFVPDEQVTTEIDGSGYLAAKTAALRAHATQITVQRDSEGGMRRRAGGGGRFALSSGGWQPISGREYFTLLAGGSDPARTPGAGPGTMEHDLFAGLDGR